MIWPNPHAVPGNDGSVVIDLHAPDYRAVFLGDLGEGGQTRMLASTDLGRVDLVKVAHHGSADQNRSGTFTLDADGEGGFAFWSQRADIGSRP